MNNQSITCPVCLEEFNTQQRIPKILSNCGHSICEACLIQILEKSRHQCPLDKTGFSPSCQTIKEFSTNYLAMQLLSERSWSTCPVHHEKRKIVCETDKALVCSSCVIFGDHKGHEVKPGSDFQSAFEQKEARLWALSERIEKILTSFPLSLQQARNSMRSMVEERFKILRLLLEQEELSIKRQIDDVHSKEKLRFEKMIPDISDLKSVIQNKLIESRVILPDANIEQEMSDLENRVNEKLIQMTEISEEFGAWREALKSTYVEDKRIVPWLVMKPFNSKLGELSNGLGIEKLELDAQVKVLLKFEEEKQKRFLGEHIYPIVNEITGKKYAPKVTGMLINLEVLELNEVLEFLLNQQLLKERVDEAMELLREEESRELPYF